MELQEFVKKTLVDLNTAIHEAEGATSKEIVYAGNSDGSVQFDIAVTAENSKEKEKGGRLQVAGVGFGASAGEHDKDTVVSRIRFGVFVHKKNRQRTHQQPIRRYNHK